MPKVPHTKHHPLIMASFTITDFQSHTAATGRAPPANTNGGRKEEEEEEEDLFEINLEAVNSFPPPQNYWESYFATTGTTTSSSSACGALMANCLLPISDVSNAVPISRFQIVQNLVFPKPRAFGITNQHSKSCSIFTWISEGNE